jgi:hypothetical protein
MANHVETLQQLNSQIEYSAFSKRLKNGPL